MDQDFRGSCELFHTEAARGKRLCSLEMLVRLKTFDLARSCISKKNIHLILGISITSAVQCCPDDSVLNYEKRWDRLTIVAYYGSGHHHKCPMIDYQIQRLLKTRSDRWNR